MTNKLANKLIIIRGAGDIATGTIHKLWRSGFQLLVLEAAHPSAIRRQVSVCEAVYHGEAVVEDLSACLIRPAYLDRQSLEQEMNRCYLENRVPVLVDPEGESIWRLKPKVVIDAILAKRNLGTNMQMAPLTIALGPGFCAGEDVHFVIETMRGHNLGRIIESGFAMPDTGVPGMIAGYDRQRVMHAPAAGKIRLLSEIGSYVEQGDTIALILSEAGEEIPVLASISGLLRGLITDGFPVSEGLKIADIDPRRDEYENCFTISDKARCIAGSVLELICGALWTEDREQ